MVRWIPFNQEYFHLVTLGFQSIDILLIVDELKNTTVMKELVDLLRVPIMQVTEKQ